MSQDEPQEQQSSHPEPIIPSDPARFTRAADAIKSGDPDTLRGLLGQDPTLVTASDTSDRPGYTLLHFAASGDTLRHSSRKALAQTLIDHGAPVDAPLPGGATPLHFAASLNHVDVVKTLLAAGASVTAEDSGAGGTPLVQALFYGCVDAAEILAEKSVAPDNLRAAAGLGRLDRIEAFFDRRGRLIEEAGYNRGFYRPHDEFPEWSPTDTAQEILDEALVYACINGRMNVLDSLVAHGARVNGKPYFATGLHHAAWNGFTDIVVYLMDHGANGALRDDHYNGEPWGWAYYGGHEDLRQYILDRASHTDLISAVVLGQRDRVKNLLNGAADPEALARALHRAYVEKKATIATLLRENGAEPSFQTAARFGLMEDVKAYLAAGHDPGSVLADGAENGQRDVCRLLIEAGASPSLHQAAALELTDEVENSLNRGADINAADESGQTALHHAVRTQAMASVKMLLARGASVSRSYDGFTYGGGALHVAAGAGAGAPLIDLLLEYGADINQSSNEGTPLDTAEREGHSETAGVIRVRGGKTGRQLGDWPHSSSG